MFVGIDVHKKRSQICIMDESGAVVYETRVPTTRADLADVLRGYAGSKVLIEASTPSEWVARHLELVGLEVVVADPNFAPMYATRSKKVKTDKRDARCLADACRLGAYRPAHRLSDEQREVRLQADVRGTLIEMRTKVLNRLSAALLGQGYRVKSGAAETYGMRFSQAEIPEELREQLKPLVGMLEPLNAQIEEMDKRLSERAKRSEEAQRLEEITAIGPLTSLVFLAALDGAQRFSSSRQVMSYMGLVPREYSSGEKQLRGHITKAGNRKCRSLLVQAAHRILRLRKPETEELCEWAEKIVKRRGKRIAAVALARRLCGIMWAMLRDGSRYCPEEARRKRRDKLRQQPPNETAQAA